MSGFKARGANHQHLSVNDDPSGRAALAAELGWDGSIPAAEYFTVENMVAMFGEDAITDEARLADIADDAQKFYDRDAIETAVRAALADGGGVVSRAGAARLLRVTPQAVDARHRRGTMPEPIAFDDLGHPLWAARQIVDLAGGE